MIVSRARSSPLVATTVFSLPLNDYSLLYSFTATDNESSEESDQSDNEEGDAETSDEKDVLNESFGLKSLLEEDSNKQSQVSQMKTFFFGMWKFLHLNHFFGSNI